MATNEKESKQVKQLVQQVVAVKAAVKNKKKDSEVSVYDYTADYAPLITPDRVIHGPNTVSFSNPIQPASTINSLYAPTIVSVAASTSSSNYLNPNTYLARKPPQISNTNNFHSQRFFRKAAGTAWEDQTLADWDPNDFRIFVGDLGNDVNDEMLKQIFNKYSSFGRAKVIRDKRTGKTRGYGFVSFTNPLDGVAALREMNGKYVGNRPIKLRRSSWQDRNDTDKMPKSN
eukprot:TRINITY_DN7415_c1_g1_i1.p1 TRINITY_DN7415_c1_g1~~TRINITY_DN7415_c1_g1_i1.p1  ORF type:complete len:230 (-),score=103.17 TRINITY_DN7415_c1_g1_i1:90-779(-)